MKLRCVVYSKENPGANYDSRPKYLQFFRGGWSTVLYYWSSVRFLQEKSSRARVFAALCRNNGSPGAFMVDALLDIFEGSRYGLRLPTTVFREDINVQSIHAIGPNR